MATYGKKRPIWCALQCSVHIWFVQAVEAGSVWTKSGDVKKNGRRKSKVWIRRTMVNPASCFIMFHPFGSLTCLAGDGVASVPTSIDPGANCDFHTRPGGLAGWGTAGWCGCNWPLETTHQLIGWVSKMSQTTMDSMDSDRCLLWKRIWASASRPTSHRCRMTWENRRPRKDQRRNTSWWLSKYLIHLTFLCTFLRTIECWSLQS